MRCVVVGLVLGFLAPLSRAGCVDGVVLDPRYEALVAVVDEIHAPLAAQRGALQEIRGMEFQLGRFQQRLGFLERGIELPREVARPAPPPEPPRILLPPDPPPLLISEPPRLYVPSSPRELFPRLELVVPEAPPIAAPGGATVDGVLVDEANLELEVARYRESHRLVSEHTAWLAVLTDHIEHLQAQLRDARTDFDADRVRRLEEARGNRERLAERLETEFVAAAGTTDIADRFFPLRALNDDVSVLDDYAGRLTAPSGAAP